MFQVFSLHLTHSHIHTQRYLINLTAMFKICNFGVLLLFVRLMPLSDKIFSSYSDRVNKKLTLIFFFIQISNFKWIFFKYHRAKKKNSSYPLHFWLFFFLLVAIKLKRNREQKKEATQFTVSMNNLGGKIHIT